MPERTEHELPKRFEQAAGLAGLLFALLMTAVLVAFNTLPVPSESGTLLEWAEEVFAPRLRIIGLYVIPFAGIAFLWFMAAIRHRGGTKTDRFFDTIFLGSGLLFIAMLYGGAAAGASVVSPAHLGASLAPDEDTIRIARLLGYSFFNVYAARAAGVFVMATSGMLLRSRSFPRWIGLTGVVVALVLLLVAGSFRYFIYLFPGWVALVSVAYLIVLRRASRDPA